MKISAPSRRLRSAAFLSPLVVVAALLAPASALAVPPTFDPASPITVTPSAPIYAGTPVTFTTAAASDPEGGQISYAWTITPKAAPNTGSGHQRPDSVPDAWAVHGHGGRNGRSEPDQSLSTRTVSESSAPESVTITIANSSPTLASASVSTSVPSAGLPVNFSASATDPDVGDSQNPGDVLTYLWSFGDGATEARNSVHIRTPSLASTRRRSPSMTAIGGTTAPGTSASRSAITLRPRRCLISPTLSAWASR